MSVSDDNDVALSVVFDPPMDGEAIKELGYYPTSYAFFDSYIMPALEQAFSSAGEVEDRTIN